MSNVCAAVGDIAMSAGSAAVTVASRGGSLVQELTFEQQLEKITARSQGCVTRYGDGQPLMVLDHTIVTNLNDLALQYEKMGMHDQAFAIGELSAWTSKSCLLYARTVKAGVIVAREGVRWADGVAHVVDKGFMDPLGLTAEMATTATKVGIAAGKVTLLFLGDQEGLADKLKVRLDGLAERAQHMSKEELFRATVATGFDILGLCIVPEAGVVAGVTAGMAVDASALATSLSTLKTAVLAQAKIAATMNPSHVAAFAPMVKAFEELPKVVEAAWSMPEKGKIINGRYFTQHALERMAPDTIHVRAILEDRALRAGIKRNSPDFFKYVDPRGIPPMLVEDAIQNGRRLLGKCEGTLEFDTESIKVIINESSGAVVTIWPK